MQPIAPNLIQVVRRSNLGGTLLDDGTFHYVVFLRPVTMRPIIRTQEEAFTRTVGRRAASFDVVINGNYFDVTRWGKVQAGFGHADDASSTTIQGEVVDNGRKIAGTAEPDRFFIAEILNTLKRGQKGPPWHYEVGRGNPPTGNNVVSALGNLGPLLERRLPYGVGNRYRPPARGPATGDPGPKLRPSLSQRNDGTFASVERRDAGTGKTFIAWHASAGALIVGVERDHDPGQNRRGTTYGQLVAELASAGFSDAVFCDGSDSAMMWYKGRMIVAPGDRKDNTMTVGLGFVQLPAAAPTPRRKK